MSVLSEQFHAPLPATRADRQAARRSLQLAVQDPRFGAQARALLAQLDTGVVHDGNISASTQLAEPAGIPLQRMGDHYIVDARPAGAQAMQLLIDTGASLTILEPRILERSGIRYTHTGRTRVFNTANGPVRAPVYLLESLSVGEGQVDQLEVAALELSVGTGIDGLLGMNFLSRFQFFIDQNRSLLRLSSD